MKQVTSIYDSCTPRNDIIKGTFNPELFTASLNQVMDNYAGQKVAETPYTNAEVFFGEATYPTSGMRDLLSTVLLRVSGDTTASAITRLETGFGGGKTHSLIGLVHCAKRGTEIRNLVDPLFPDLRLPAPGTVDVVAIAGDVLSVNKSSGAVLIPHTLWGELAMQVGGERLYRELENDVTSVAAPGKDFFKRVFDGRRAVILIDELAQYVARFEAAHPKLGATQVAAFLMSLSTFSRSASGIAVVISLASSSDAFARQSDGLSSELTRITGSEVAPQLDFVQNRPRPENFVCGDFVPSLLKGKNDSSEVPTTRYWLLHRMRDCGSRCSLNSSRLITCSEYYCF